MGRRILGSLGYTVVTAANGTEALELFRSAPKSFDLVITDQTMPDLTGDALTEKLLGIRADLPIILCTGFSDALSPEQAKVLGVREFLSKPITISRLARVTRAVLDQATT